MNRFLTIIIIGMLTLGFSVLAVEKADQMKMVINTAENYINIASKYSHGTSEEIALGSLYVDLADAKLKTAGLTPGSGDEVKKLYDRIDSLRAAAKQKNTVNTASKSSEADSKSSSNANSQYLDMAAKIVTSVEHVLPQLAGVDRQLKSGKAFTKMDLARHRSNVIRTQYALTNALKLSERVKSEEAVLLAKKIRDLQSKVDTLYQKVAQSWNASRGRKEF